MCDKKTSSIVHAQRFHRGIDQRFAGKPFPTKGHSLSSIIVMKGTSIVKCWRLGSARKSNSRCLGNNRQFRNGCIWSVPINLQPMVFCQDRAPAESVEIGVFLVEDAFRRLSSPPLISSRQSATDNKNRITRGNSENTP
jgi:hypothetical protein